jgi:Predicted secreted protein containing a PDZ domain
MELTYIVLLALLVVYIPFYFWVRYSPNAAKRGLVKYGPMVMVKTKLGTKLMEKWCVYTRFWRFFGALSLVISAILMVTMIFIMIVGIGNFVNNLSAPGLGVEYALAIPGLNPLLPIWYGIIGLAVAMIVHELAHGMQTRSNGMRVDSTGLLIAVVPMGAFVEPNEEDVRKSSRRVKLDLYSAGISVNFITAIITFTLFAGLMLGGISSDHGGNAAVYSMTGDSPAFGEIPNGSIILEIDGEEYIYSEDYSKLYSWNPGDLVEVKYLTESGEGTSTIPWGLYIERVTNSSPAEGVLRPGTFIFSIETEDGVVHLMYGQTEFTSFMSDTRPGETVTITYGVPGEAPSSASVVLGSKGDIGFLGVSTTTSGMIFRTPDSVLDQARNPFYNANSITSTVTSMLGYIAGPFNGFSPMPESAHWWYDVPLEEIFWIIVMILYWIFWFNIMLGVSNAIPAYPFDGGFIFLGGLNGLLEKLGVKDEQKREETSSRITSAVSTVMIFMFVMIIAAVVL